jgi:hypothetical protein
MPLNMVLKLKMRNNDRRRFSNWFSNNNFSNNICLKKERLNEK